MEETRQYPAVINMKKGWTYSDDGTTLTLSRPGRFRMDVGVEATFQSAGLSRRRLARQIRQDVWRACQNVRGFSPVIKVTAGQSDCHVVAGGQIDGARPDALADRIAAVLHLPRNRTRWTEFAS